MSAINKIFGRPQRDNMSSSPFEAGSSLKSKKINDVRGTEFVSHLDDQGQDDEIKKLY